VLGYYLVTVSAFSPASSVGLVAGDIITAFNGYPITDSVSFMRMQLKALPGKQPNCSVKLITSVAFKSYKIKI
jgi:S1-C subfamily serine protease